MPTPCEHTSCRFYRYDYDYESGETINEKCNYYFGFFPQNLRGMTLTNFQQTPYNTEAYEAAQRFVTGKGNLYLFGNPGTGKTHLLSAAYQAITKLVCPRMVAYHNTAKMLKIQRDEFQTREEAELAMLESLSRKEFIFLDDFSAESVNPRTVEFFYSLINDALERGKPKLFITANKGVKWVSENISDRIGSRIAGLCGREGVIKLDGEDFRMAGGTQIG